MAILMMVIPTSDIAKAQETGGYWELISVDMEEKAPTDFYTYNISRGSGTVNAESNGESFQASMTWTEPGQRYVGGQRIDLTISVNIDEYIWDEDEPGYINQGLNYMSASITARIDEPDIGAGGVTRSAISLTDSQGEYIATVETDYGKIVNGNQTLQVSAEFPSGGSDGDKKSIYVSCTAGMNRYNYQWVESESEGLITIPENLGSEQEPEWEPLQPTSTQTAGGLISRVIVVVGIAIAGTMSAIAGELANKAAQAAASENDEQPTQEIVYVMNPSHKQFNLQVNQPVTLTVTGYRVTQDGYQIEKGALISISLPPDLTEYFSLQTTGSNGQISSIITLLKMPSASAAVLGVNGVFPQGKANTQVQLAFEAKFSISPVNTPKITYYQKDEQWKAPELMASFRDPVQNTPVKVGFYYGFMDPPLTFEPDILEVKESYSSDDGLTYNFKLSVKEGINLETFFGEDLTDNDGRVTVSVVVKDDKGKEYTAKTELQVSPQLRMIAYSYNKNVKTRGHRESPYKGLVCDEMEFIADGVDKLPLVIFFIRSDKKVIKGSEAEAVMDIVEVEKLEWSTTESFEEPEINSENTSDGFFAYDLISSGVIAADKNTVSGIYRLDVEARIRAGGPKNYSFERDSMQFTVKPQFILLRLWVVPGYKRSTSEAIAYAKLLPSHKPFTGLTLSLETSGGGGAALNPSDGYEKVTQIQDPAPGGKINFKMVKGTARWILTYSGLTWSNLSGAQFQVTCNGPRDKVGNFVTASDSFDVNTNVLNMLSDLLSDSDIQAKMNNPYFKDSYLPYCLRGPVWNIYQKLDTNRPYVCHQMRSDIIDYLQKRRNYRSEGDLAERLASMRGMNGIEYEKYYVWSVHVWAGFFLSGSSSGDYKALDPWWEQRWDDPSFNKPENLMTTYGEAWNLSKMTAAVGVVVTAAVSALAAVGVAVSAVAMATLIKGLLLGLKLTVALEAAGLTNVGFSSYFDYDSLAYEDGSLPLFPQDWLIEFIQRLNQQDLNEWRES
jgi:hypothetical protein